MSDYNSDIILSQIAEEMEYEFTQLTNLNDNDENLVLSQALDFLELPQAFADIDMNSSLDFNFSQFDLGFNVDSDVVDPASPNHGCDAGPEPPKMDPEMTSEPSKENNDFHGLKIDPEVAVSNPGRFAAPVSDGDIKI